MDNFSITQNGKPLDESKYTIKYTIDLEKKVFISVEDNLVLDFTGINNWTFRTGNDCTFQTGWDCTFKTGNNCTFNTCSRCTFQTYDNCTFQTGHNCTFKTGVGCTFSLYDINSCKFKSYDGVSIVLDRVNHKAYKLTREFVALQKIKNG